MNLFKGLLFLHGHLVEPEAPEPEAAPRYGNAAAAEREFRDTFAQPTFARRAPAPGTYPARWG